MIVLLNTPKDMKWLRDVHLQGLPQEYESAVVHGNEDSPSKIEVFTSVNPEVNDVPVVFVPGLNGRFEVQLDI